MAKEKSQNSTLKPYPQSLGCYYLLLSLFKFDSYQMPILLFLYMIIRLRSFMQEFVVKYAQKSTKICKNVLKYALNMQKNYFQ